MTGVDLVCVDMAGTTVRDDGAVEEAFGAALAAVGVEEGSERRVEADVLVRSTMGWSKADVFAVLLDPRDAATASSPRSPVRATCCASCGVAASGSA